MSQITPKDTITTFTQISATLEEMPPSKHRKAEK